MASRVTALIIQYSGTPWDAYKGSFVLKAPMWIEPRWCIVRRQMTRSWLSHRLEMDIVLEYWRNGHVELRPLSGKGGGFLRASTFVISRPLLALHFTLALARARRSPVGL